nr:BrnT family toxin [Caballeronia terrestris]
MEFARQIDWSADLTYVDSRRDYGEVREVGYGPIESRLYCVVFTQRVLSLRIISLRKANYREVDRYVQESKEALARRRSGDQPPDSGKSGRVYPFRRRVRAVETIGPSAS